MPKEMLKITDIIRNEPRELEIPGIGTIKVRDPTVKDRIDAEIDASKHPLWNTWDLDKKQNEIQRRLAVRMIVDPVIKEEDYNNSNDTLIFHVIDVVLLDYWKRLKDLADKRKGTIQNFLEQMKEDKPKNTTGS